MKQLLLVNKASHYKGDFCSSANEHLRKKNNFIQFLLELSIYFRLLPGFSDSALYGGSWIRHTKRQIELRLYWNCINKLLGMNINKACLNVTNYTVDSLMERPKSCLTRWRSTELFWIYGRRIIQLDRDTKEKGLQEPILSEPYSNEKFLELKQALDSI